MPRSLGRRGLACAAGAGLVTAAAVLLIALPYLGIRSRFDDFGRSLADIGPLGDQHRLESPKRIGEAMPPGCHGRARRPQRPNRDPLAERGEEVLRGRGFIGRDQCDLHAVTA